MKEAPMKTTQNTRLVLFTLTLAFALMACNLLTGQKSPAVPSPIPSIEVIIEPTATIQHIEPTATPQDTEPTPEMVETTPTVSAPNVIAGSLQVLEVSGYTNTFGNLIVVGLVTNQTERAVDMIEIEVEVLDTSGNSLYQDITYTALDNLAPGETSPFSLSIYEDLTAASEYVAIVVGNGTTELDRAEVQITNTQIIIDDDGDIYVTGELVNDNYHPVIVNSMAAATLDEADKIVTANYHSVLNRYIDPGQSGYFRVMMTGPTDGTEMIKNHVIYIDTERREPFDLTPVSATVTADYVDTYGYYHLVGEVTNSGEANFNISLVAAVVDNNGNIIDAADINLPLDTLAPGESAPYDFTFWGPLTYNEGLVETIDHHVVVVDNYWSWTTETAMIDLFTSENASEYNNDVGTFSGKIVNNSNGTIESAVIVIALRDLQSGEVVATNYDYSYDELPQGATYDYMLDITLWPGFDETSVVVNYIVKGSQP